MADGVLVDNGSEADYTVSTDEVNLGDGLMQVQRIKILDGTNGGTAAIGGDATNGLDVDVTRVSGNVTVIDGGGSLSVDDNGGSLTIDDGGSTLSVDDGGGILTVDGAVTVSGTATVSGVAAHDATISGNPVYVAGKSSDVTPAAVSADGEAAGLWATREGALVVANEKGGSGAKSNVSGSASSVTILAANTSRKGVVIVNDSTAVLYIDSTGGTASATSFTERLNPYDTLTLPHVGHPMEPNAITGIWTSATGSARVKEIS